MKAAIRKSKHATMDALIKALPAVLRAAGDSEEVVYAAAVVAWRNVAGEALRELAIPIRMSHNTLTVAVTDGIWQKQLEAIRSQLLFRLNSVLGQPVVKLLEFRIQPDVISAALEARSAVESGSQPDIDSIPIPMDLLSAAAGISDVHLRNAFLGAARSCLSRQEADRKAGV